MANGQGIIQELEIFLKEIRDYYNYRAKMDWTGVASQNIANLRRILVSKSGKYKRLIAEIAQPENVPIIVDNKEYVTDIWSVGLLANVVRRTPIALEYCINGAEQAIGKLEDDIAQGIRDGQGNLIAKRQIPKTEIPTDTAELPVYLFDKMQFHPKVIEASRSCFIAGNYRDGMHPVRTGEGYKL